MTCLGFDPLAQELNEKYNCPFLHKSNMPVIPGDQQPLHLEVQAHLLVELSHLLKVAQYLSGASQHLV